MADVGGEENAGDVGGVGDELANGKDGGGVATLDHTPDVDITLSYHISNRSRRKSKMDKLTALLPAQTILPSLATVTLATLTSSSGMS